MEKIKKVVTVKKFYIVFDEAEYNGDQFFGVLLGILDSTQTQVPFLIDIMTEDFSPNQTSVQQSINCSLTKLGLVNNFQDFCLFLSDGTSYNSAAARALQMLYPKLIPCTCYTHMLARLCAKIVEREPSVKTVIKNVKKVSEKCKSHVKDWVKD